MLKMKVHVLSVRYGSIEENNLKWAKVQTLEDEIEVTKGFVGQRLVEYSVPHEHVDSVQQIATQPNVIPNKCELSFISAMSGGKAVLKCVGLTPVKV